MSHVEERSSKRQVAGCNDGTVFRSAGLEWKKVAGTAPRSAVRAAHGGKVGRRRGNK